MVRDCAHDGVALEGAEEMQGRAIAVDCGGYEGVHGAVGDANVSRCLPQNWAELRSNGRMGGAFQALGRSMLQREMVQREIEIEIEGEG